MGDATYYSCNKRSEIMINTEIMKAVANDSEKEGIKRSLIRWVVNITSQALITKVNKPNVKKLIGREMSSRRGRNRRLISPRTRPAQNIATGDDMMIEGNRIPAI
jgi:hypothetical protein